MPAPWGWINPTRTDVDVEFSYPYIGISNQFVFTLAGDDQAYLLVDSTGSDGLVHTQHVLEGSCVDTCTSEMSNRECYESVSGDYESVSGGQGCHKWTWYAQVIGCTLHTSQNTLTILQDGTVAPTDRNKNDGPREHPWGSFKWEDPTASTDIIAKEFLNMMVPHGCNPNAANPYEEPYFRHHDLLMSGLLGAGIANTHESLNRSTSLQDLEDMLEQMTASYLWNVLQSCPSDPAYPYTTGYRQCQSDWTDLPKGGILNSVSLTRTETRARLEVVRWKAVVAFAANMGLLVLACSLLGIRTDRKVGEPTSDARFVDQVALMKDSTLPNVVAENGAGVVESASIRLRYTSRTTGDGQKIDVHTET
ncbi:hypothetical protein CYLTODRAFT_455422 [Cylindrobasidium torrendii FP15055 ss-10]|uniref:Uncharacterized protein n=1 Tax=Cylindrobasidium torrendii FP15055 ss-10 TaxID=1314674 RepID=A0A0D7B881_9AGAR|nr:hypothetical protein CYLTODRAFT_455422 [Cylindrobasidium torrendii FP15055 ss-10]